MLILIPHEKSYRLSISLPESHYKAVRQVSTQKRASLSWVIRDAIREYLEKDFPLGGDKRKGRNKCHTLTKQLSHEEFIADYPEKSGSVLIDPPWRFVNRTGKFGARTSVSSPLLAKPQSHLYLWCPNALLVEGLHLMQVLGFKYKTKSEFGTRSAKMVAQAVAESAFISATSLKWSSLGLRVVCGLSLLAAVRPI